MNEMNVAQESEPKEKSEHAAGEGQFLAFWIEQQLYGLPIQDVVQIIGVHKIIPIPEYPDYAKGIINLRGSIIPVIDIRLRFRKEEKAYDERTCIIVSKIAQKLIGFAVDAVDEVTTILPENIKETPRISNDYESTLLNGIGKIGQKVILLVNASKIVKTEEMSLLETHAL